MGRAQCPRKEKEEMVKTVKKGSSDQQFVRENSELVERAGRIAHATFVSMTVMLPQTRPNDILRAMRIAAQQLGRGREE